MGEGVGLRQIRFYGVLAEETPKRQILGQALVTRDLAEIPRQTAPALVGVQNPGDTAPRAGHHAVQMRRKPSPKLHQIITPDEMRQEHCIKDEYHPHFIQIKLMRVKSLEQQRQYGADDRPDTEYLRQSVGVESNEPLPLGVVKLNPGNVLLVFMELASLVFLLHVVVECVPQHREHLVTWQGVVLQEKYVAGFLF